MQFCWRQPSALSGSHCVAVLKLAFPVCRWMREPREFPAILNMFYDLTKRLQLLHSAGQVHRDLKPVRLHLRAALAQAALRLKLHLRCGRAGRKPTGVRVCGCGAGTAALEACLPRARALPQSAINLKDGIICRVTCCTCGSISRSSMHQYQTRVPITTSGSDAGSDLRS